MVKVVVGEYVITQVTLDTFDSNIGGEETPRNVAKEVMFSGCQQMSTFFPS